MTGTAEAMIGSVFVSTTQNRGFGPEEVADRCVDKIIFISENADPAIRNQALAYKENMKKLIAFYMREAITSDRTTIFNALSEAGQKNLAEIIRKL